MITRSLSRLSSSRLTICRTEITTSSRVPIILWSVCDRTDYRNDCPDYRNLWLRLVSFRVLHTCVSWSCRDLVKCTIERVVYGWNIYRRSSIESANLLWLPSLCSPSEFYSFHIYWRWMYWLKHECAGWIWSQSSMNRWEMLWRIQLKEECHSSTILSMNRLDDVHSEQLGWERGDVITEWRIYLYSIGSYGFLQYGIWAVINEWCWGAESVDNGNGWWRWIGKEKWAGTRKSCYWTTHLHYLQSH